MITDRPLAGGLGIGNGIFQALQVPAGNTVTTYQAFCIALAALLLMVLSLVASRLATDMIIGGPSLASARRSIRRRWPTTPPLAPLAPGRPSRGKSGRRGSDERRDADCAGRQRRGAHDSRRWWCRYGSGGLGRSFFNGNSIRWNRGGEFGQSRAGSIQSSDR